MKAAVLTGPLAGDLDISSKWQEVVRAMFMVSELMAAEQVPEKDGDLEEEDFLPLTIQGLYFNRFEAPAGLLGRYSDLLFFRPYEQQHQKSSNWLDTRALFKQATGMDPFEFLAVGAVVLAHFLSFRTPKDLATRRYQLPVKALSSRLEDAAAPERFLTLVGRTLPELRIEYKKMPDTNSLVGASQMPLFTFPLAVLPASEVIPASISRFVDALSIGMYWRLHTYLSQSNQKEFLKFTRFVGELFQDHVYDALSSSFPDSFVLSRRLYGEIEYSDGRAADAALVYEDSVIFFEVSSSRLRYREAVRDGEVDAIDQDIDKCIVSKAAQLDRVVKDFRRGKFKLKGLLPSEVRRIYPVVVLLEPFPLFLFTVRRINQRLEERGLLQETEPLRVISIEELERVEPLLAAGYSLREILENWMKSSTHSFQCLKNFLVAEYPDAQVRSKRVHRHYSRLIDSLKSHIVDDADDRPPPQPAQQPPRR